MTREEKLEAIYAEMANKEKTLWCKYLVYENNEPDKIIEATEEWEGFTLYFGSNGYAMKPTEEDYYKYYSIKEVVGHPVMIGDVMDWIWDKRLYCYKCKKLVNWRDVSDDWLWWEYYCDICNSGWLSDVVYGLYFDWEEKRKPIEDQTEGCINYVYSLIQKD